MSVLKTPDPKNGDNIYCGFCDKSNHDVEQIYTTKFAEAVICSDCIDLLTGELAKRRSKD